jgi:hypothetical protein
MGLHLKMKRVASLFPFIMEKLCPFKIAFIGRGKAHFCDP